MGDLKQNRPLIEAEFAAVLADAGKLYKETSGQSVEDYMTPPMKSLDDLKHQLDLQNERFSAFRAKRESLFGTLSAMLKPVEIVGDIVSNSSSDLFPPSQGIYSAVMYLVNAANDVSSTYDSISELFEQLKDFTSRLNVYLQHRISPALRDKVVSILAALFEVLVLATKEVRRGRVKAYFKNLFGSESPVQPALERLKNLTLSEERQVLAETYGSVATINIKTDRVESLVGEVNENVQELRSEYKERIMLAYQDKLREILEPSPFPEDFYSAFTRSRVKGTGEWVLEDEGFRSWIQSDTRFLWISGGAGTGKSFLASRLISWGADNLSHLAYFYFRANNPETRSVLQALRDVAYQLSESDAYYGRQLVRRVHCSDDIKTIASAYRKLLVQPFEDDTRGKSMHIFLDGIDEAAPGEIEELLTQLAPNDEECSIEGHSRIHIALVGRSYMSDLVTLYLDPLGHGRSFTTVLVTPDRNQEDVRAFIEEGVLHSRILSRSTKEFKSEVIQTMEKRVEGLFILAKFMLADVNRARRPSSILKSLESYPQEINGMLVKTLADVASTISEEEASDLNEMLRWVACAEQALTLEQLEAILVLRFGDPPFCLEETLRGQYACFFDLEREDGLTTDDLIKDYERMQRRRRESNSGESPRRSSSAGKGSPGRNLSPAQQLVSGRRRTSPVPLGISSPGREFSPSRSPNLRPFRFDMEQEMEFRSKKSTTTVNFFHTSVREFFRDDNVKVSSRVECSIGFDTVEAKLHVLKTCLQVFTDDVWFDKQRLGQSKHSIKQYAAWYWQEHLAALSPTMVDTEDKISIGNQVYKMLTDERLIYNWSIMYEKNDEGLEVLTDGNIKALRKWMGDADILAGLDPKAREWANELADQPAGLSQSIGRFYAKAWLDADFKRYIPTKFCFKIVQGIAFMDSGYSWSDSQRHWTDIAVSKRITKAAEWAQYSKTAHWYRRIGSTYLISGMHNEALEFYNEALKLDCNSVETSGRMAFCLFRGKKYKEALDLALECESVEEKTIANDSLSDIDILASMWRLYKDHFLIAQCYYQVGKVDLSVKYFQKAMHTASQAGVEQTDRFELVAGFLDVLAAENRHGEVMKLLENMSIQATSAHQEQSRLVDFLLSQHNKSLVMDSIPKAACKNNKADFLIERLELCIDVAHALRDPLKELYLRLALGTTLIYARNIDDAIEWFEQISLIEYRPRGNVPTRQAHALSFQKLGFLYKDKILHVGVESHEADRWISKLEHVQQIQSCHQNLGLPASILGSDVNTAGIYLALIYRLRNKPHESTRLLAAMIVESCEILEDEHLRNDEFALENLVRLFVAAGEIRNATALAVSMRRLNPDVHVSPTDSPVMTRRFEPKLMDIRSVSRSCVRCLDNISPRQEFFICRYCLDAFCCSCLGAIKRGRDGGEQICRKDHDWFEVPPLGRVLHTGEILLDGEVTGFRGWKDGVKKRWEARA